MGTLISFDPRSLLRQVLASQNCRHEWATERWSMACRKCGLIAYLQGAQSTDKVDN